MQDSLAPIGVGAPVFNALASKADTFLISRVPAARPSPRLLCFRTIRCLCPRNATCSRRMTSLRLFALVTFALRADMLGFSSACSTDESAVDLLQNAVELCAAIAILRPLWLRFPIMQKPFS